MRKFIFVFFILTSYSVKAQKLEFSLSGGTGKTYIIESLDKSVDVNYGLPLSMTTELKFTPQNSKWGLKIRLHDIQSAMFGQNWMPNMAGGINGYISSRSTFLLLENTINKNKSTFGFNFGLGYTNETRLDNKDSPWDKVSNKYPTLTFGANFSFKINNELDFQILPIVLVQDPFRSISYLTGKLEPTLAGEDLSILINFGIRYNILRNLQPD